MRVLSPLFALALIAASLLVSSTPASANHGTLSGTVTDVNTGAPVKSPRAFARLVVAHRGIYQMSGVALDEHADPTVERFVWR